MKKRSVLVKGVAALVAAMSFFASTAPAQAVEVTYDLILFEVSFSVCRTVSPGVEVCQAIPG